MKILFRSMLHILVVLHATEKGSSLPINMWIFDYDNAVSVKTLKNAKPGEAKVLLTMPKGRQFLVNESQEEIEKLINHK